MRWFKFYGQDYISDPKMLSLTACERSCWITLLAYSSINDNGMITFLSEEQLMLQANISPMHEEWEHTIGVLEKFRKLGMITIDNEMITVNNWQKRQETNLTSYERVKRYRQKKQNDNAKITLEENRIEENRIDIESKPTPKEEVIDFLNKGETYNKVVLWLEEKGTPKEAILKELNKFISYWSEKNSTGNKQRWQMEKTFEVKRRLATWLSKVNQFNSTKKGKGII